MIEKIKTDKFEQEQVWQTEVVQSMKLDSCMVRTCTEKDRGRCIDDKMDNGRE